MHSRRILTLLLFSISLSQFALSAEPLSAKPTFYKDILPLFQENCQECHRASGTNYGGMVAPMALTTYDEARPWAKSILKQVKEREMPPWDADVAHHGTFRNERSLTDEEIATIERWVGNGAPRGNRKDAPAPLEFENNNGWMIGEPDLVVAMPKPYFVSDDVYDQYTAFSVDLSEEQLPEDAWITAFQCKPGSNIVHHFNCHLLPAVDGVLPPAPDSPESSTIAPVGAGQYIGGVSSGSEASVYPKGFGLPLTKGTRVTFDIHYHKEAGPGTAVTDRSHIGFKLTNKEPERALGGVPPMMRFDIDIAPGDPSYKMGPVAQVLPKPVDVVALMPHMHMRGDMAKFEAFYPDGTSEVLLNVPRYDFSWQTVYYFNDLKRLPAGTRVEYSAWYNNSPEKAAKIGFDPEQRVRFGQKSSDEMMMGFMMGAVVSENESD